jgi:hypothetical protein
MNGCQDTKLEGLTLQPMQVFVFGPPAEQPVPEVVEASGKCGEIIVEVSDQSTHQNYLTKQGDILRLESTSDRDEGRKTVSLVAYLRDYPDVKTQADLEVTVDPCRVTDLSVTIPDVMYTIRSGEQLTEPFTLVTSPAACNSFTITSSYSGLPSFITEGSNRDLIVSTMDTSQA